ncbi:hypothetical protein AB7849_15245 [Rhodanobacter sp. 115]|uniref:hypothetical protein n=1 Tax=Rhodanobacter sp. FW021-MT20 TaxID=1162282 RepID=UPI0034E41B1F
MVDEIAIAPQEVASEADAGVKPAPRVSAPSPQREGFVRISLHARSKSTSVSMDALLYKILALRLGGDKAVKAWAQKVARDIESLEARGVVMPPRDVKASLSRLVQRQALRTLWSGDV